MSRKSVFKPHPHFLEWKEKRGRLWWGQAKFLGSWKWLSLPSGLSILKLLLTAGVTFVLNGHTCAWVGQIKVHNALHLSTHGRPVWPMEVRNHHRSKTIVRHPLVAKREAFPVRATKVYVWSKVTALRILILGTGWRWPISCPGCTASGERPPGTHWIGAGVWAGGRVGLDVLVLKWNPNAPESCL